MEEMMKKKIWSSKTGAVVVVMTTLLILGITGCGNDSDDRSQETVESSVHNSDAEAKKSSGEDTEQAEKAVQTEEPEPTQEPTPEPTPEEEKVEMPEIDERYEYHLYCMENMETPLIGINNLEDRDWTGVENTTGDRCTEMFFLRVKEGVDGENLGIWCSHPDHSPLESNEKAYIPRIVLSKEKKATVDTAFGEAEIYWVYTAYENIDNMYDYDLQEIDGKEYRVDITEIAVISIENDQVYFSYHYTDSSNEYKQGDQYRGVLEEVIAQMLEPK